MRLINSDSEVCDARATSQAKDGASSNVIRIDFGKTMSAVAVCAAFAALGVGLSAFAVYTATQAAMEARILQQHVTKLEVQRENDNALSR